MPLPLCTGTTLTCIMGLTPTVFIANPLPGAPLINGISPAATIDQVLLTNIPSFGMCTSPTNPAVIAATTAALGVPTPAPCVPVPAGPWAPPSLVAHANTLPLATVASKCICALGGLISVTVPVPGPADLT
ncbi:MAG: DUF4280 domain-containing protein [Byssovorax sp.]